MNRDFVDLLRAFAAADVRFLVVGAYALAHHGRPRATGDLDVWVDATEANAARIMRALAEFGAPLHDVGEEDFARPGIVFQIGVPPGRIDILTELTGVSFDDAWRVENQVGPEVFAAERLTIQMCRGDVLDEFEPSRLRSHPLIDSRTSSLTVCPPCATASVNVDDRDHSVPAETSLGLM